MGRESQGFLKVVASGRSTRLQWRASHPGLYGQHNLNKASFLSKSEEAKLRVAREVGVGREEWTVTMIEAQCKILKESIKYTL